MLQRLLRTLQFVYLFGATIRYPHSLPRLLVTDNVVPSAPILVPLKMEAIRSTKTLLLARATLRRIPEDCILQLIKCPRQIYCSMTSERRNNEYRTDCLCWVTVFCKCVWRQLSLQQNYRKSWKLCYLRKPYYYAHTWSRKSQMTVVARASIELCGSQLIRSLAIQCIHIFSHFISPDTMDMKLVIICHKVTKTHRARRTIQQSLITGW
jgi:hypothetical protein